MPIRMEDALARSAAWGKAPCVHDALEYEYFVGDEVVVRTGDLVCLHCGRAAWSAQEFAAERPAALQRLTHGDPVPDLAPLPRQKECAHPHIMPEYRVTGPGRTRPLADAPTGLFACVACGEARELRHFPEGTPASTPKGWPRKASRPHR